MPELTPVPAPPALEGWWFAPAGTVPEAGTTRHEHVAPSPRHAGLHAARSVLDALPFARSAHLCRVALSGRVVSDGALSAASERAIRWCFDPSALLRSIAVEIARSALADHALDAAPAAVVERIAARPVPAPELGALRTAADRARDAMIDAEDRLRDAQWRIEQLPPHGGATRRDAALEDAGRARRDAASHRARAHALDALELAAGDTPAELGAAIDAALRACAWRRVAARAETDADAITSAALDAAIDEVRAHWSVELDRRVLAIADALAIARATPAPAGDAPAAPTDAPAEASAETSGAAATPPRTALDEEAPAHAAVSPETDAASPSARASDAPAAPVGVAHRAPQPRDHARPRSSTPAEARGARRESLLEGLRVGSLAIGVPTIAPEERPSFTGHPVALAEPAPRSADDSTQWERSLRDTLRGMPATRRAARLDADESDPLACPVVLVLVEPFEHWPGVLEALREVRDELFHRTPCLLVGDLDLPRAFASGRYACSEGVAIDWGQRPEDRGAAFGDAWLRTFWIRGTGEDAPD